MKITHFSPTEDNTYIHTSPRIRDVIDAIVKLGGSYTDVVAAITQAKEQSNFTGRVKFDALPRPGRSYKRDEAEDLPDYEDVEEDVNLTNVSPVRNKDSDLLTQA